MTTDGPPPIQPNQISPAANPMGLRLAQAYGVRAPAPTPPPEPAAPITPSSSLADKAAGPVERLVAGVVPGAVSFKNGEARPTEGALPFYRHPADQNAAATGVQAGRTLDVEG